MTRVLRDAVANIRQLCLLGVSPFTLLPALLPAIRALVPADHGAFFFCDGRGNITNLYAERLLPSTLMDRYHQSYFKGASNPFPADYLRRVSSVDPVSRRTLTDAERESGYYRDILSTLEAEHFAYAIIRDPRRRLAPVGQLSLYRSAQGKAFDDVELSRLRDILHYIGQGLSEASFVQPDQPEEKVVEEAIAVLKDDGTVLFADRNWDRLVRMARGTQIAPSSANKEPKEIRLFQLSLCSLLKSSPLSVHEVRSAWGRFAVKSHKLENSEAQEAIAIQIQRMAISSILLINGASKAGLSVQQREVALLIANGLTNKAIAEKLGISPNTANYHVKQVFSKLGARKRTDVAELLQLD